MKTLTEFMAEELNKGVEPTFNGKKVRASGWLPPKACAAAAISLSGFGRRTARRYRIWRGKP